MTKLWQRLLMQQQSAPAAASYRYWRIRILTNHGNANTSVCEVKLSAAAGGPTLTTPSTPVSASSVYGPYSGSRAVDGLLGFYDIWLANGIAEHIAFDLLTAVNIQEISIRNQPTHMSRRPKDFIVQASNNSITGPWTDMKTLYEPLAFDGWRSYSII